MSVDEERIALFLDYENLAIGARDALGLDHLDFRPIADALAERGRVVVRRAYADWSYFPDDRRVLARAQVELIELPQRLGVRKNAADIKMVVDALELAFERDYLSTFVICTGDSDFTPLVHKLRELNKKVIGVGVKASTSSLLPPACDEFLFYDRLEGVEATTPRRRRSGRGAKPAAAVADDVREHAEVETEDAAGDAPRSIDDVARLLTQTLAGLQRSAGDAVRASALKRAMLRKDPTFSETDFGFRAFGELLRHLQERGVIALSEADGGHDPEVDFPAGGGEEAAFELLRDVVESHTRRSGKAVSLSGLKNKVRKRQPDFSEKQFGFGGFLQFCKSAATRGYVDLVWDEAAEDYVLSAAPARSST